MAELAWGDDAFALDAEPTEAGVGILVGLEVGGVWRTARLDLTRCESRRFADKILEAGGDGTLRSFKPLRRPGRPS